MQRTAPSPDDQQNGPWAYAVALFLSLERSQPERGLISKSASGGGEGDAPPAFQGQPSDPTLAFFRNAWLANIQRSFQNGWMTISIFVRTVAAPPQEFSWAWALECPASERLNVSVVREFTIGKAMLPREDELILWFGVPDPCGGRDLFSYLSEDERTRAARFRFEPDRWSFAAAHAGLRAILGPMALCPPHALRFAASTKGKPYLDQTGQCETAQFSISHTRGCVAIAVAGRAVGIDVEFRRPIPDLMAIAKTAFAPEGQAALATCPGWRARTGLFYRYWTLGEAFIKATGEGISQDLTSFVFSKDGVPVLTRVSPNWGPVGRWRFYCEP
jgi:4'-phosphopantetheinyl transferase